MMKSLIVFFGMVMIFNSYISTVNAHSWMSNPQPRRFESIPYNLDSCKPDKFGSAGVATYTRGQQLDIKWYGNNHVAGFVQLAIVPKAETGINGVFQRQENIVMMSCYRPRSCPKTGPEFGNDSRKCSQPMTIPSHLPDGEYTLQWVQFGSGGSNGRAVESLPDYTSCHDFRIKGGVQQQPRPQDECPVFHGGDFRLPGTANDACTFYTTNAPGFKRIVDVDNTKLPSGQPQALLNCKNKGTSSQPQFNPSLAKYFPNAPTTPATQKLVATSTATTTSILASNYAKTTSASNLKSTFSSSTTIAPVTTLNPAAPAAPIASAAVLVEAAKYLANPARVPSYNALKPCGPTSGRR